MKVRSENEVAQSCPTLCDPMDCSLPGSSVHGIFQARVLEWGAIAFSDSFLEGLKSLLLSNTVILKLSYFILRGKGIYCRIDFKHLPTALWRVFFRNLHTCFSVWSGKLSKKQPCNYFSTTPNWNRFRSNICWLFPIYNGLCLILVEPHEIAFLVGQKLLNIINFIWFNLTL